MSGTKWEVPGPDDFVRGLAEGVRQARASTVFPNKTPAIVMGPKEFEAYQSAVRPLTTSRTVTQYIKWQPIAEFDPQSMHNRGDKILGRCKSLRLGIAWVEEIEYRDGEFWVFGTRSLSAATHFALFRCDS